MSSYRKDAREYRATRDYRTRCVERLVHGLNMTPVAWSLELAKFVEVPAAEAFQVRCHCGNRYRFNSRHHIEQHHMNKHGLTFGEALRGASGGQWERDRIKKFLAEVRS